MTWLGLFPTYARARNLSICEDKLLSTQLCFPRYIVLRNIIMPFKTLFISLFLGRLLLGYQIMQRNLHCKASTKKLEELSPDPVWSWQDRYLEAAGRLSPREEQIQLFSFRALSTKSGHGSVSFIHFTNCLPLQDQPYQESPVGPPRCHYISTPQR